MPSSRYSYGRPQPKRGPDGLVVAGWIIAFAVIIGILVAYHVHVENDCHAQGGIVKWIYTKSTTNYLCIKDGRIIG